MKRRMKLELSFLDCEQTELKLQQNNLKSWDSLNAAKRYLDS